MKNKRMILGIAGYIASGKSEAGRYFAHLGAKFIEADQVVNELYRPGGDGYRKIVSFFGREYLRKNGEINRKKLAKFVFSDGRKLKILNSLIHPLVCEQVRKIIGKSREKMVVIEAAYFEKKRLLEPVDRIIWIECGKRILKRRAIKNNRITGEMFERIIGSQSKPEKIDYKVDNGSNLAALHGQLKKIYVDLCGER